MLVVFSFYNVTASSNKRSVMPTLVLRVGLIHEPVDLAKISSLAVARIRSPPALDQLRELGSMVSVRRNTHKKYALLQSAWWPNNPEVGWSRLPIGPSA